MKSLASVFEVFSGIQGEGVYVGRRHLFVRFCGCNLSCDYCDTVEAREPAPYVLIEPIPGAREFEQVDNPVHAETVASWVARFDPHGRHDAVSLTGGEPLLSAEFIVELAPRLEGRRVYLETNGTLPDELEKVIGHVHTVAMDIKLASSSGHATDLNASRTFLEIAARREAFVKVVVTDKTDIEAVVDAARVTASVSRAIPFVIQPVTPVDAAVRPPSPEQLLDLQLKALKVLEGVLVIPQVHKLMGQD